MSSETFDSGEDGGTEFELTDVRRVGEQTAEQLRSQGVETVEELAGVERLADGSDVFSVNFSRMSDDVRTLLTNAAELLYDDEVVADLEAWFDANRTFATLLDAGAHVSNDLHVHGYMTDDERESVRDGLGSAMGELEKVMHRIENEHHERFVFMTEPDNQTEQGESKN